MVKDIIDFLKKRPRYAIWVDTKHYNHADLPIEKCKFPFSGDTVQALFKFDLVNKFNELPTFYFIDEYEEGVLLPEALNDAAKILRNSAEALPLDLKEFVFGWFESGTKEVRIDADMNNVKSEFLKLALFFEEAFEKGYAVQIVL